MFFARNCIFIFFTLILCSAANASVNTLPWQNMETVGKSTLRFALWKIYDAELLSPNGQYQPEPPFALQITYLVSVKNAALVEETEKQWQKLYPNLGENKTDWIARLAYIFPDVKKGDEITFYVSDSYQSNFYHNGKLLGFIDDPEFSQHFAGIWLSEKTSRPKLRKKLIGK